MTIRQFVALLLALTPAPLLAADWPQFRGPDRDGVAKETGLLKSWPEGGPPLAWTATGLGDGYSSLSVAGNRIYTLGNKGRVSNVVAIDRDTGKVVWAEEVGRSGGHLGCTPTVEGDRIYALGQEGDLVCLTAEGKRVWHRNLLKEFGGQYGGWHYCESPLVDGDRVIVTPGGTEATMVALKKATGETIWKCPISLPEKQSDAGYSSAVIATVGGVKHYVQLFNGGLMGVSTDGKLLWRYAKLGPNTANIPTPIVLGEYVFSSAGYGKGAALLKLKAEGEGVGYEEVYFKKELTNKHGGVIRVGDHLFGDTDDSGRPFCADFKTGKVLWKKDREGRGGGSVAVTAADGRLYLHYQDGWVVLAEASPGGYNEVGSFKAPKQSGNSWAHPVVCDGRLYIREGDRLYCYDVRDKR
jgi:outer membrane protein assembly factor BamB